MAEISSKLAIEQSAIRAAQYFGGIQTLEINL
jgi:hypothetical protein